MSEYGKFAIEQVDWDKSIRKYRYRADKILELDTIEKPPFTLNRFRPYFEHGLRHHTWKSSLDMYMQQEEFVWEAVYPTSYVCCIAGALIPAIAFSKRAINDAHFVELNYIPRGKNDEGYPHAVANFYTFNDGVRSFDLSFGNNAGITTIDPDIARRKRRPEYTITQEMYDHEVDHVAKTFLQEFIPALAENLKFQDLCSGLYKS